MGMTDICTVEGCEREVRSRSWCKGHYDRWLRIGEPGPASLERNTLRKPAPPRRICLVEGCLKLERVRTRQLCAMHDARWVRYGDPLGTPTPKPPRPLKPKKPCSIDGCPKVAVSRGWCVMHHTRWLRNGDPGGPAPRLGRDPVERFWENVDKDGPIPEMRPELGPCWTWNAYTNWAGYGSFYDGNRRVMGAHKYSYELHNGPVPVDMQVDHLCWPTRNCVNPAHLEAVTPGTNQQRAAEGRRRRKELKKSA